MYTVVKEPTSWIDVEWEGLDEEGFERTNTIRMKVVLLPMSEMVKVMSPETETATVDLAKRIARDWSQIVGPDKKPWPFTAKNLEELIEHTPGFGLGLQVSYSRAWQGRGKVREKKSERSPHSGRAAGSARPPRKPRASKRS